MAVASLRVLLGLDATEFTAGLTKAEVQAAKFAESQKRNQASIDRQVSALQRQADGLGRTTRELKLMELSQRGATEAQLKSADAALRQVEQFRAMESTFGKFSKGALAFTAVTAAIDLATQAAVGFIQGFSAAAKTLDDFNDVADVTGSSVEKISGLERIARLTGGTLETVETSLVNLNKALRDSDPDSGASRVLRGLGLDAKELRSLDPSEAVRRVAVAFQGFAADGEKARALQELFKKSAKELAPFLKDVAENIDVVGTTTGKQTEEVEKFRKTLFELETNSEDLKRSIINGVVPALNESIRLFREAGSTGDGLAAVYENIVRSLDTGVLRTALETLGALGANASFVIKGIGREIGGIAAQLAALAHGDFKGFSAISDAMKADAAKARAELDAFEVRLFGTKASIVATTGDLARSDRNAGGAGTGAAKPSLKVPGAPDPKAAAARKKALEAELEAIRAFGEQQAVAFETAGRLSETAQRQGIVSLQANFDAQREIRARALSSLQSQLDAEVAVLEAAKAKAPTDERADIDAKIAEAKKKRSTATQKAANEEAQAELAIWDAVEQTKRRYEDLRATILGLSGDTAGAARIQIAQQIEEARRIAAAAGENPAVADELGRQLTNTEALKQARTDYGKLLDRAQLAEESIAVAAQEAGTSELDVLRQLGAARASSLEQLRALTEQARELARVSGTEEARKFAEELSLAYRKAALEVDPLLQKTKELGKEVGQSIASGLEAALTQGKSLRDVLKGIYDDLVKIATRELVTKPFEQILTGGNGGGGGLLGGFLGSVLPGLFGGGSGFGSVTGGSGGFGQVVNNPSAFIGGLAGGGPAMPGSLHEVAENRPEVLDVNGRKFLLMGKQRGNVDPNPRFGKSSGTVNANINVQMPPGTTRQTMMQTGAVIARQLQTANRRLN